MQVIMVVVIANNYATEDVEEIVQTKIVQVLAFIVLELENFLSCFIFCNFLLMFIFCYLESCRCHKSLLTPQLPGVRASQGAINLGVESYWQDQ